MNFQPTFRILLPAALSVCALGCSRGRMSSASRYTQEITETAETAETAAAQLATLNHLYYRGNPSPPAVSTAETEKIKQLVTVAPENSESKELRALFGERFDVMAYAHRDTDGDGVLDFRVGDMDGKFFEGDVDLDGDGIRNVLDLDPFDPGVGGTDNDGDGHPDLDFVDGNNNRIPDHVDWQLLWADRYHGRAEELQHLSQLQSQLYQKHRIIMVERNADFTPGLAEATFDTVTGFYRSVFKGNATIPTLRTVASEEQAWLDPDDGETCAMVFGPSGYLGVYGINLQLEPFFMMTLLVHELGHSLQFAMDYDQSDPAGENARQFFPMPNFMAEVADYGWRITYPDDFRPDHRRWFASMDEARGSFFFHDRSPDDWQEQLTELYDEFGDQYLLEDEPKSYFLVSDYSLTDPLEWEADNLIAYYISFLEDSLAATLAPADMRATSAKLSEEIQKVWPGYQHNNIRGSRILTRFKQKLPQSSVVKNQLVEKYLRPLLGGR